MGPRCTVVTTSMGRLHHLRRSVPSWLSHTPWDVVVADHRCPDGSADWAASQGPRARGIRVPASPRPGGPEFDLNAARHAGASEVGTPWIAFVDADVLVEPGFAEWAETRMVPGSFAVAEPSLRAAGTLLVSAEDYLSSGGFDLGRTGYGCEELELRVRLRLLGLTPHFAPSGLSAIRHGLRDRIRSMPPRRDPGASFARLQELVLARFGVSVYQAAHEDPVVRRLLLAGR